MQALMPNLAALPRPVMLMAKNAMVRPGAYAACYIAETLAASCCEEQGVSLDRDTQFCARCSGHGGHAVQCATHAQAQALPGSPGCGPGRRWQGMPAGTHFSYHPIGCRLLYMACMQTFT